jgi:MoxR-like ATPase
MIARLVDATHPGQSKASSQVKFGAGPRAAIALASAVKAHALLEGRVHAGFEDVKMLALPVLRHRVILDYRAKLEGYTTDKLIQDILNELKISEKSIPSTLKES